MPEFVTSDVQMVIQVNFSAGDKFQIGYRSVAKRVGPRIPRTKGKTSTLGTPLDIYDSHYGPSGQIPGTYGYRPHQTHVTPAYHPEYAQTAPPGLFGPSQVDSQPSSNGQTQSNDIHNYSSDKSKNTPLESSKNDKSRTIKQVKSKNSKNSVILGLLWAVAMTIVIAGVYVVVHVKYKDKINFVRRRTEQRPIEAKL